MPITNPDVRNYLGSCTDIEELRNLNLYVIHRLKQVRALQSLDIRHQIKEGRRVSFSCGIPQGRGKKRWQTTTTGVVDSVKQQYMHVQTDRNLNWGLFSNTILRVPMSNVTILGG